MLAGAGEIYGTRFNGEQVLPEQTHAYGHQLRRSRSLSELGASSGERGSHRVAVSGNKFFPMKEC